MVGYGPIEPRGIQNCTQKLAALLPVHRMPNSFLSEHFETEFRLDEIEYQRARKWPSSIDEIEVLDSIEFFPSWLR